MFLQRRLQVAQTAKQTIRNKAKPSSLRRWFPKITASTLGCLPSWHQLNKTQGDGAAMVSINQNGARCEAIHPTFSWCCRWLDRNKADIRESKTIGPQSNRLCRSLSAEFPKCQHLLPAIWGVHLPPTEVCHESQRSDAQGR